MNREGEYPDLLQQAGRPFHHFHHHPCLLRLGSQQLTMYCRYHYGVKSSLLCLLVSEGSMKGGGGGCFTAKIIVEHDSMKNTPKNRGQVHLFLEYLEHVLCTPFDLE